MITFDTHELTDYEADLGRIAFRTAPVMISAFREAGDHLTRTWAAYARQTSGTHGKHYPDSIDSEMRVSTNIVIEVGPNSAKPQGSMAFETGSVNQPPHPDGQRAADHESPLLDRRIDVTLSRLGL